MSKMPGGVATGYDEDILRNLTQSQSKIRDCSRNRVLKPSHTMENYFGEEENFEIRTASAKKEPKSENEGHLTIDVFQTEDDIVIQSTIAGVDPENDLDISVTTDMVTIKGRRAPEQKVKPSDYYWQELYWGPFSRSIILPVDIDADNAKASYKNNGVLTIKLPRLDKVRTKKIKIS